MSVTVTIPTVSSIKIRFPEFADVADPAVEFAIEEAREEIGTNWTIKYNTAIVYLVAHYIACGIAAVASGGSGDGGDIASESIGRFSISYATSANSEATHDDKSSSSYGRRYLDLLGRNFGGPLVI
jgi:hypothetical protein